MKNIFKKNQIIITALAIMIVIAGYLSFTNNDKPEDDTQTVETANPDQEDFDISDLDGTDLATDTTGGTADSDVTDDTDAADDTDVVDDTALDDTDAQTTAADEENDETTPVDTENESDELGDLNDDEILAEAQDVSDTGEIESEDETIPGEAVLASTTIDPGYFSSAKLEREQRRSISRETLLLIIDNPDVTEEAKKVAINSMVELTKISEKENALEIVLTAKGFDGVVVSIDEDDVEVIVNAENITEQQVAIIEDEVKRKTDVTAEHIVITPVVVGE
jgi:stage III sporulation protein AH